MVNTDNKNIKEIINQIVSLKEFYVALGIDSVNTINIFNNTIAYLKGEVGFEKASMALRILVEEDKLVTEREINLLNCLDELMNNVEESKKNILNSANFPDEYQQLA